MDDAADHPPVIDPRNFTKLVRQQWPKPLQLLIAQPEPAPIQTLLAQSLNHIRDAEGILFMGPDPSPDG
jgi:hypothetical protein